MNESNVKPITVEEAIIESKQFRKDADELLQRMKKHTGKLKTLVEPVGVKTLVEPVGDNKMDKGEVIANHILSVRHVEDAIMRQGMALKNFGTADPYPSSKDPSTIKVEPTADGLKL